MTKPPSRKCIVCGRPVPRRTILYTVWPLSNRSGMRPFAVIEADLRTTSDCLRHTNLRFIISNRRDSYGFITSFAAWDGESYMNGGHFCTNRCAQDQGHASAQHGYRFTWKRGDA